MTGMTERPLVTMQEITEQRDLGWPDFHPEDYLPPLRHRQYQLVDRLRPLQHRDERAT